MQHIDLDVPLSGGHRRDRPRLPAPLPAGPAGHRAHTDFERGWSIAASSSTAQPIGTRRLHLYPGCAIQSNHKCGINIYDVISKRCEMSTQSLRAPSLRTGHSLPATRWVRRMVNYLIYQALWLIMPAISRAEPSFLPALREARRASALNAPWLDCVSPEAGVIDWRWTGPRTLLVKLSSLTARICMSTRTAIWPPVAGTARPGCAGCWRPREHYRWISFCWPATPSRIIS